MEPHRAVDQKIPGGKMKKFQLLSLLLILLILMAACGPSNVQVTTPGATMQLRAPGSNPMTNQPDSAGLVARAGAGLWHGIIAPITLILSFFDSNVRMYEVHNVGSEYDFGFLLGVMLIVVLLSLLTRLRR